MDIFICLIKSLEGYNMHNDLTKINSFMNELKTILLGKEDLIFKITATILTGGNILLEDLPGVGKTVFSKAIARLIFKKDEDENANAIDFKRIQGTPDLLPYDITGVDIYNPDIKEFIFNKGPVFTDILLADELNRTTPKVQSALLQAMAEKEVTIGNNTYKLPPLFFVIATENPIESEGTYPLPVAQLDRFSCLLEIGYPDFDIEKEIFVKGKSEQRLDDLQPVISVDDILRVRLKLRDIEIDEKLYHAIAMITKRSREHKEIKTGLSTRAGLMMIEQLRAYAYLKEREFVTDQDIIDLAVPVWAHRLIIRNPNSESKDIIDKIVRDEIKKIFR